MRSRAAPTARNAKAARISHTELKPVIASAPVPPAAKGAEGLLYMVTTFFRG